MNLYVNLIFNLIDYLLKLSFFALLLSVPVLTVDVSISKMPIIFLSVITVSSPRCKNIISPSINNFAAVNMKGFAFFEAQNSFFITAGNENLPIFYMV